MIASLLFIKMYIYIRMQTTYEKRWKNRHLKNMLARINCSYLMTQNSIEYICALYSGQDRSLNAADILNVSESQKRCRMVISIRKFIHPQ